MLLANGIRLAAEEADNTAGQAGGPTIAFDCEWHSSQCGPRTWHEGHKGMDRGKREPPAAENSQLVTAKRPTGMEGNFSLSTR